MPQLTIFIITLNPDSEQVRELLTTLGQQGVKAECFMAVDGRGADPELLEDESINQTRAFEQRLMTLTSSEIGCYMSHLRAVKEAHRRGDDFVCIMEDDVAIESSFASVLEGLQSLPVGMEFIRLMGLKKHKRKVLQTLIAPFRLTRPIKGLCGTQGYLLNRQGMEKVIANGCVMVKPIDKFYDHFWEIDLQAFCVEPHIIWELTSSSSVKKRFDENIATTFMQRLRYKLLKTLRSFKRKCYVMWRWSDFYPAAKATGKQGKTARIR